MTRWLLVSGDFTPLGGMDRANHALAAHLASQPSTGVHLVTHRAWHDLEACPHVHVHRVARPLGSHLFGAPLLAAAGERQARRLRASGAHVVANGGNADAGDACWIHYVHAAYAPAVAGSAPRRWRTAAAHRYYAARERAAVSHARVILCNSRRTADDVVRGLGADPSRVRTVYYGADAGALQYVTPEQRTAARGALQWGGDRFVALFVGALGDRRKGFDRLFEAWSRLTPDRSWDVDLVVAGEGGELGAWRDRARKADMADRVRFLGFRTDVPRLLAASDLLVHPARYEAYGLGVHEAICRGVPAIVAADAGVAERYPPELGDLLLQNVEDVDELCGRLLRWRAHVTHTSTIVRSFADRLRGRSWTDMAEDIVRAVTA